MKAANNNIIVKNKNAARNYHLTDKYQAGIVLEGWEVKGLTKWQGGCKRFLRNT